MKDKIKEIILSVNPGMDVEDEDFNIAALAEMIERLQQ